MRQRLGSRPSHLGLVRSNAEAPDHSPETSALEVVVDGRRFRLVPLDEPVAVAAPSRAATAATLTGRELQIAALVAEGRVNKQIAAELRISEWTVSTHLRRIFAKLGVDTRAAMVGRCADVLRLGR